MTAHDQGLPHDIEVKKSLSIEKTLRVLGFRNNAFVGLTLRIVFRPNMRDDVNTPIKREGAHDHESCPYRTGGA
jgi:hypothetical protein